MRRLRLAATVARDWATLTMLTILAVAVMLAAAVVMALVVPIEALERHKNR